MRIEALVFRREKGALHALRDRGDGQEQTPFPGILGKRRSVIGVKARHDRRLPFRKFAVVRQAPCKIREINGADTERGQHRGRYDAEDKTNALHADPDSFMPDKNLAQE